MTPIEMENSTEVEDYIDQLSRVLPLQRSFTTFERVVIVFIVSTFVSCVGCILLYLFYSRARLKRKYYSTGNLNKEEQDLLNTISRRSTPPPSYESIDKTDETTDFNQLARSPYLHLGRKLSNGTVSDSDGTLSHTGSDYTLSLNDKNLRSQSARSSFSNGRTLSTISNTYPLAPYVQINVEIEIDTIQNLLNLRLTNGEHVSHHPAFDDQAEYFIRIQLTNNKLLKKFHESSKKHRANLSLTTWNKQPEKTTKNLSRTSNDTLICNEDMQFQFDKSDITLTSLRFLLFCTDRSGLQDLMFEGLIPLRPSMIPKYQEIVEFQSLPQITFGEVFLGMSYLPTAERFTLNINKLRYFCKTEKENRIDVRLTATFLHHGRRFFQKKIPFILNNSLTEHEIKDTITQNIPQHDIQSVYVHVECHSKMNSSVFTSSILLGEQTRYQSDWQKMLEHPRQTHLGCYQFLG